MARQVTHIRIFVASPGEVQAEREALAEVVEDLQHGLGEEKDLFLELVRWETHAYPAMGRVQGVITEQLDLDTVDVFVGIFWKRFGTPTGEADSGTEEEFERAYAVWQEQGRPPILFYFCERPYTPRAEDLAQIGKVLAFREAFPEKGLYWTYTEVGEFKRLARRHLEKTIRALVAGDDAVGGTEPSTPGGGGPQQQASVTGGSAAISQGEGTTAVQAGETAIGHVTVHGDLYLGARPAETSPAETSPSPPAVDPSPPAPPVDPDQARRDYLEKLYRFCQNLPLGALGDDRTNDIDVTLNQVYVSLDTTTPREAEVSDSAEEAAERRMRQHHGKKDLLPAQEAMARTPRMVLLGDPGAGKSTFVKQLAARQAAVLLGQHDERPPGVDPDLLPVYVTLRDLAPVLAGLDLADLDDRRRQRRLAEAARGHVVEALKDLEAVDFAAPLHDAFTSGQCLLVLDGLDEVPDAQRPRMREAVDAVRRQYRLKRVLVTCRIRSYEGQARLTDDFTDHTLAPFDADQIRRFATAWYGAQKALGRFTEQEAGDKANKLGDAATRPDLLDLAGNPMLLTTMALIHQRDIGLPSERVKLYRLAVDVLLRRWQKRTFGEGLARSEALAAFLKDDVRVRPAMHRLAYEAHRAGVAHPDAADLKRGDAITLLDHADYLGSTTLAAEFLDYVDQRTGLLVGRGGEEGRPAAYSFPHRTFQEYLAGCYLVGRRNIARAVRKHAHEGDDWTLAVQLGAEELYYNRDETGRNTLLDTIYRLGDAEPDDAPAQRALLWAGAMAALVGTDTIEQDEDEGGAAFLDDLRPSLVGVLRGALPPPERAQAGHVLARLGDPRVEVLEVDPMLFCYVPGGPFTMGASDEAHEQASCVEGYWMAQYPVTQAQYHRFVEAQGYEEERFWTTDGWRYRQERDWEGPRSYREPFGLPNHPVVGVSWYEALAFTRWLTERWHQQGWLEPGWVLALPNEPEWEKAARGGVEIPARSLDHAGRDGLGALAAAIRAEENPFPDRAYPWGGEADPDRANYSASRINATSAVGCFPGGASPYGVEDLSGNVWEWTRSLYRDEQGKNYRYPYDSGDGREDLDAPRAASRVLRGGAFDYAVDYVRCSARFDYYPDFRLNYVGFRVVFRPRISDGRSIGDSRDSGL